MNNIFKRHILAVAIMAAMPMAIYAEDSRDREHSDEQRQRDDKAPAVSGELVIQFKKDATDADKARVLGKIGGEVSRIISGSRSFQFVVLHMNFLAAYITQATCMIEMQMTQKDDIHISRCQTQLSKVMRQALRLMHQGGAERKIVRVVILCSQF